MTAGQVARAIRHQQRAQRIVTQGSYPRQFGRWAWRHRRVGAYALGAVAGLGVAAVVLPVAAVAGVGLGAVGVARHPAVRRVRRKAWSEAKYRSILFGRWVRRQWRKWRGIQQQPLVGQIIGAPNAQSNTAPKPDIVDAEIVPNAGAKASPTAQPELATPPTTTREPEPERARGPFAPPHEHRQQFALANRPTPPAPQPQENTMRTFDSLTEGLGSLPTLSLGPGEGGGHDVERWGNSLADFIDALAERTGYDASSIVERFPMDSAGRESMSGLGTVFAGIASQVREQVEQWKADASWQYTDNNA